MNIAEFSALLRTYLEGGLSREAFSKRLEEAYDETLLRAEKMLAFEDLFLVQAMAYAEGSSPVCYSNEELRTLQDAIEGRISCAYTRFIRIRQEQLSEKEGDLLVLAKEFLKEGSLKQSFCLKNQRREFFMPKTLPASIAYELEYLLWIAVSKKRSLLVQLSEANLCQKIAHCVALLSGDTVACVTVGVNQASVR